MDVEVFPQDHEKHPHSFSNTPPVAQHRCLALPQEERDGDGDGTSHHHSNSLPLHCHRRPYLLPAHTLHLMKRVQKGNQSDPELAGSRETRF